MTQDNKDTSILFARLDDLCRAASEGSLGSTSFLSPRDLHFARAYLTSKGTFSRVVEWGGYADAERKRLFILPDYMEGVCEYQNILEYGFDDVFCAIEVRGSGYRVLSHRDYLGSVIGLGLDRSVIGDILVYEEEKPRAVIICETAVTPFICENLSKVGSDTVRVAAVRLNDIIIPERRFLHVSDTVASPRLDGVLSALISVSRERAKEIVLDGAVEVDYEVCERPDRAIAAPCIVTVRGYGKYRINSLADKTKKGRVRLDADKYV